VEVISSCSSPISSASVGGSPPRRSRQSSVETSEPAWVNRQIIVDKSRHVLGLLVAEVIQPWSAPTGRRATRAGASPSDRTIQRGVLDHRHTRHSVMRVVASRVPQRSPATTRCHRRSSRAVCGVISWISTVLAEDAGAAENRLDRAATSPHVRGEKASRAYLDRPVTATDTAVLSIRAGFEAGARWGWHDPAGAPRVICQVGLVQAIVETR